MKVTAFNGSPRPEGNTYTALRLVADQLEAAGIEVEIIQVGNKLIRGCLACGTCAKNRDERCTINDEVNGWIQKMKESDGILLGSPTYFSAIAGTMKSFLDRAFYVAGVNGSLFRHKVGAAVVAVRRSGGLPVFTQLNNYLTYSEMLLPGSNYWNVIHGTRPGDAVHDPEGVQIMEVLGKNMAMLLRQREGTKEIMEENPKVRKQLTNFIR